MRFFMIPIVSILALVCLVAVPALAQDDLADRIQQRYESVNSFETRFEQVQTRAAIGLSSEFSGRIWYKRPSLVRWETIEPEDAVETIVIGPEKVWDWLAELNTVQITRAEDLMRSKTLLRFISGEANLTEDFRVEEAWDGDENLKTQWAGTDLLIFRLVPHEPEAGMMLAYIGVDPESYLLTRVMVVDYQGNANELHMVEIEVDKDVPDETFTFVPPDGAEIQDLTTQQP